MQKNQGSNTAWLFCKLTCILPIHSIAENATYSQKLFSSNIYRSAQKVNRYIMHQNVMNFWLNRQYIPGGLILIFKGPWNVLFLPYFDNIFWRKLVGSSDPRNTPPSSGSANVHKFYSRYGCLFISQISCRIDLSKFLKS